MKIEVYWSAELLLSQLQMIVKPWQNLQFNMEAKGALLKLSLALVTAVYNDVSYFTSESTS